MSTRATISLKTTTKAGKTTYKAIYQHWDGYPTGLGVTLRDHYKTPEAVKALLKMGSASSVKETLETSEFYHRDRGEAVKDTKARTFASVQAIADYFSWCEWHYVIDAEGKWDCHATTYNKGKVVALAPKDLGLAIALKAAAEAAYYAQRDPLRLGKQKQARKTKTA
jgi:hypothetical protein